MRRLRALLLALLALAPLLAGCTRGDDTPAAEAPAEGDLQAQESRMDGGDAAPDQGSAAPPPRAGNATQPAPATPPPTTGASNHTPVPPPPPPPRTREVTAEGSVTAKAGVPCQPPAPCPPVQHEAPPVELALPEAGPAKATLVAAWEAGQANATLAFNVSTPEGVPVAAGEGAPPLTLVLPADAMRGVAKLVVTASPVSPGLMVGQRYNLTLSLEYA